MHLGFEVATRCRRERRRRWKLLKFIIKTVDIEIKKER